MKLQYKMLVVFGLIWAIFFVGSYYTLTQQLFIPFLLLALATLLLTLFSLYILVIRHIQKLNKKLALLHNPATKTASNELIELNDQLTEILSLLDTERKKFKQKEEDLLSQNQKLQQEISEQTSMQKEIIDHRESLKKLARYDNLTGLPNNVFFNEILYKAMSHAKRHNKIIALLYVDIDNFKKINSTFGHGVGDHVLKEVGNRFATLLRAEDILAKDEGDEFIILLNDIGKSKFASSVAEKLLQGCAKPIKTEASEIHLSVSIGISIYPTDGGSLEDLLKNLEAALYKAKQLGGNTYQFHTPEMNIEAQEYIQLETALRKAIQNNELALYYQPQLHIKNGNITTVESLLRWIHPTMGMVNPAKFIPIAEDAGLIMQIGEWALREACKTNKHWQDEGYEHISIAVNLSPKQFYHPDIAKIISNVLAETGLNPRYLELEITESTVMDNIELAMNAFNKIKATGVQMSIDHFGTGHTSISHIKQFPISTLKIDQNFIRGIPNNPNDSAITTAVIALAHNLGLTVVAQGVETAEQVQFLALQNCDMVQGYYLGHPLPAEKIVLQFTKLRDDYVAL